MTGIEIAAEANCELLKTVIDNVTEDYPKTWVWHKMDPTQEQVLNGLDNALSSAFNWQIPLISDTADFVLGSDLAQGIH